MVMDLDTQYWDGQMLYESSGLEELPDLETFGCRICGLVWRQVYIEGITDV